MKKAVLWIFGLLLFTCGSFAAGRYVHQHRQSRVVQNSPNIDNRFSPADFPTQKRSFVLLICAFNNGAFLEKTLRSVSGQSYENYRLIYIDDASTDGSAALAADCINACGLSHRTTLVRNEQRLGTLANLMRAAQVCEDQEIIVMLGGNDWLAHEWVLSRLNQYYANPDLWLTYSQYCDFPSYRPGISRDIQQIEWSHLRSSPFVATHLPTFYAALFRRISEADLLFQGAFWPQAAVMAIMLPMLEMARDHFQFVPDIQTIANRRAETLEDREHQIRCERSIRAKTPYSPVTALQREADQEQDLEDGS
ncbi:MAG: hypothetical protein HW387_611 [Parachlamydiales bacterium]|nr:hypothetical protein [Parachlamydiales bacterium]